MDTFAQRQMTVEEFLDWDDGTNTRYELVAGVPAAMEMPTEAHGTIVANATAFLHGQLKRPCRPGVQAGIRLPHANDRFYIADVAVTCTPPVRGARAFPDPILNLEVLSPSTAERDRGTKMPDYMMLESLRHVLFASATERRVQLWTRDGPRWTVEDFSGEAAVPISALSVTLPLGVLYESVAFD